MKSKYFIFELTRMNRICIIVQADLLVLSAWPGDFLIQLIDDGFLGFFSVWYLALPWPILSHSWGYSLCHPIIIAFASFRLKGHRKSRNEFGSLSPAERVVGFEPDTFRFNINALSTPYQHLINTVWYTFLFMCISICSRHTKSSIR